MPQTRRRNPRSQQKSRSSTSLSVPVSLTNLPIDPPTIKGTMKRTINLLLTETSSAGVAKVSYSTMKDLIAKQLFGNTSTFARYVVNSVKIWGSAGDSTAISLTDVKYGISSVDSGSFSRPPKVGLFFPAATQDVHSTSTTGDMISLTTTPDNANFTMCANITVWTSAAYDF